MNTDLKPPISHPPAYLIFMMYLSTLCLPALAIPLITEIIFNLGRFAGLSEGTAFTARYTCWFWGWLAMHIFISLLVFVKFIDSPMKYTNKLVKFLQLPFIFIPYTLTVFCFYTGPAGFVLYMIGEAFTNPDQALYFYVIVFILSGVSGLYAAVSIFRRSVWLFSVENTILNLPTSKTRGAAIGLVELKGKARGQLGRGDNSPILYANSFDGRSIDTVEPFYIEDDSGRLLVQLPPDYHLLSGEQRVILKKRYRRDGVQEEIILMPGDEILVLGYLNSSSSPGDPQLVRPVEPPGGSLFSMFSKLPATMWYGEPPYLFLITDSNETDAKKNLFKNSYKLLGTSVFWAISALWVLCIGLYGIIRAF